MGIAVSGHGGDLGRDGDLRSGGNGKAVDQKGNGVRAAGRRDDGERMPPRIVGDVDLRAGAGAIDGGDFASDSGVGEFKFGVAVVETGAVKSDFVLAGGDGDRRDSVDVRRLPDVERVGEVRIVVTVGGLDNDDVLAVIGEAEMEERIPDKSFLGMREFAARGIGENQRGVQTVAVAGGAEIEEPMGVFGGVESEEVEVAIGIEPAEDGRRDGRDLR